MFGMCAAIGLGLGLAGVNFLLPCLWLSHCASSVCMLLGCFWDLPAGLACQLGDWSIGRVYAWYRIVLANCYGHAQTYLM